MSATDSSSEPSPKQQDDVPWARPEEFEAKKGVITHLYDLSGRNLTLKETMRIMEVTCTKRNSMTFTERAYGPFLAEPQLDEDPSALTRLPSFSAKMYKSRISKWKLRKNLKPAEVIELVRQYKEREAAGKSTHVYFRGERMDQRRVREYLRLVHGMSVGPHATASEKRIKIEGITCRTPSPPPTAPQTGIQTPMRQMPIRTPESARTRTRSPGVARAEDESGAAEDGGVWVRVGVLAEDGRRPRRALRGHQCVQCFDDFTALMRNHHPLLWIYTHRVAMELAEQSPEAAQSFARLAWNLSQALNHPAEVTFDQMPSPVSESNQSAEPTLMGAREICEFYRLLLMEQVGLDHSGRSQEPFFAAVRTAHYDMANDVEFGYSAMHRMAKTRPEATTSQTLPPHVGDLKRKEYHAWRTYYNGYYEDAAQIMREVSRPELIEDIAHYPDSLFSYYDTAALLARNRSNQDEEQEQDKDAALGAFRTLIDFSTNEYGLASLQTIDALAELETHLRRRQQQHYHHHHQWDRAAAAAADGVLQEVHAALDLLDYQTDPDLRDVLGESSLSYSSQRVGPSSLEGGGATYPSIQP
ncbi:hypothetical protein PG997_001763 [Apiospora hydei]|uniref:Clr5 domain-containing protein n=1 Tax=Apiospora hydei TaxID=1337664 RepID=A0ABR1XEG4_9PEZI